MSLKRILIWYNVYKIILYLVVFVNIISIKLKYKLRDRRIKMGKIKQAKYNINGKTIIIRHAEVQDAEQLINVTKK